MSKDILVVGILGFVLASTFCMQKYFLSESERKIFPHRNKDNLPLF